ncbi:hypothetical protein, partial [Sphingomonas sanguinis]|uniref:hypothetical protein n=1 Tax=Sphingomonas sanguinis TaxID=33051 RepID=UPI0019D3ABBA
MANDAVDWLATVSRHCRKMIELAGLAIRDQDEYETQAARNALREALGSGLVDHSQKITVAARATA